MNLQSIKYEILLCRAFGHRWIPYEGEYVIIGGAKAIQWQLRCDNACQSTASEMRYRDGERVEGSYGRRKYKVSEQYRSSRGWRKFEYVGEFYRRNYQKRIKLRAS